MRETFPFLFFEREVERLDTVQLDFYYFGEQGRELEEGGEGGGEVGETKWE